VENLERFPDPVHDAWFEVVGVVADTKNRGLREPAAPFIYVPSSLTGFASRGILLRTTSDSAMLVPSVIRAVHAVDPDLAFDARGLGRPATLRETMGDFSLAQPRFSLVILSVFAGVGALLGGLGVYSVTSYTVSRRTQEIFVRMAPGAQPADIRRMVVTMVLRLIAWGTVLGLLVSFALARLLASQIWGVAPGDPLTLASVSLVLVGVGLAAAAIPAARASRISPMAAVRHD
jgi:putative ABC transport system permease protein